MSMDDWNIWQGIGFMAVWYASIFWFAYKWKTEIIKWAIILAKWFFIVKLYLIMTIIAIKWLYNCGTKYYIVTYRYANDEEGIWRVIEFPPIR